MKRSVDLVASARQAASAFGVLALLASPAFAGDRSLIDFIGFSADAKYFAFEEFGIQDGSGFPYSNIYVVDLTTDTWVEGTPVRYRAEDETRSLLSVRAEANNEALRFIGEKDISIPAEVVALIGDGVPNADGKTLAFGMPAYAPGEVADERRLELSTFPATSPEDCSLFGNAPLGYELRLSGGTSDVVLHHDNGPLPSSRGCPLDYRLHAVALPGIGATQGTGVVIVSVYPGGFEGPDRRFLAVPFAF